jgi:uncharacterized protein YdhG (YjbR/CyaY superfamily)
MGDMREELNMNKKAENIDEYIALFPEDTREKLKQMRALVIKGAPDAAESISYGMPYYNLQGRLLYFAAFKNHIGLYPMASAITKFQPEISKYKFAKGSVQFPLDKNIPAGLVLRIVKFRVKENIVKAKHKSKK